MRAAGICAGGRWHVRHGTLRAARPAAARQRPEQLQRKHARLRRRRAAHGAPSRAPRRQDIDWGGRHTGSDAESELDMATSATAASTMESVSTTTLHSPHVRGGRGETARQGGPRAPHSRLARQRHQHTAQGATPSRRGQRARTAYADAGYSRAETFVGTFFRLGTFVTFVGGYNLCLRVRAASRRSGRRGRRGRCRR